MPEHRTSQEIALTYLVDIRQLNLVSAQDLPKFPDFVQIEKSSLVKLPLALLFSTEYSDSLKINTLNQLFLGQGGGDSYSIRQAF